MLWMCKRASNCGYRAVGSTKHYCTYALSRIGRACPRRTLPSLFYAGSMLICIVRARYMYCTSTCAVRVLRTRSNCGYHAMR